MSDTQKTFLDSLTASARDNPVAAALIGGGALWLLMGNEPFKRAAGSVSAAAAPLADIGARGLRTAEKFATSPPTAPEMENGSSHLGETLRGAARSASDAASDAAGTIKARFDDGVNYAQDTAQSIGGALPGKEALSSLSDLLQRQPLVLGAIGLAVGAAVASAFTASDLENEWIGEFSDTVKADLNVRAEAVSQSVREASDSIKAEITDVASQSAERLRNVGSSAAEAAQSARGR